MILASASLEPYLVPLGELLGVDGRRLHSARARRARAPHGPTARSQLPRRGEGPASGRMARGRGPRRRGALGLRRLARATRSSSPPPTTRSGSKAFRSRKTLGRIPTVSDALTSLRRELAQISDLVVASRVLEWDQLVMMPRGGAATRSDHLATLNRLAHELFIRDEIGELLERAATRCRRPRSRFGRRLPRDRVTRRDWEKARRIPPELRAAMTKLASEGVEAWAVARRNDDFESFRPWLDRTLELKHRYIECFPATDDPYDLLLDDFEPGMRTDEVRSGVRPAPAGAPRARRAGAARGARAVPRRPVSARGPARAFARRSPAPSARPRSPSASTPPSTPSASRSRPRTCV